MPLLPDILRTALPGAVIGASIALAGQASPPFHVLAHELSQVFAVVAGLVQLAIARRVRRRRPTDLDGAFVVALGGALGLGVGVQAVASLANALQHGCDPAHTGLFLWITWAPLGVLMTVIGLATASWRRLPTMLAVALLIALSFLHDTLRARAGLYMADPLIGFPLATEQRATMSPEPQHVLQRGWLLAVALTGWLALRARTAGMGLDTAARTAIVAVTLITIGWAGRLGMGPGPGARRVLDGEHRGEHVLLRYDRSGVARSYLAMIEQEAEWAIHRLTEAWGIEAEGVWVAIDVYDDEEALFAATGHRNAYAIGRSAVMIWTDALDDTMHHEMVHVLEELAGKGPWWRRGGGRGRTEGSAEAWTDGYAEVPETHGVVAVAARRGRLPSARELLSPAGFWTIEENMAYRASGSFVGFLILRYGVASWRRWLATNDLEAAYGKDVDALDAEWRAFLRDLEPSERAEKTATWAFDPVLKPPATRMQCPKLGHLEPDPLEIAQRADKASDNATAFVAFRELYAERPTPWLFWKMEEQLEALGRHDEALAELDRADAERVGPRRVAEARTRCLAALDQGEAALVEALDARLALGPHPFSAAARRLLDVPELAPSVPALLVRRSEEHSELQQAEVIRLVERHPEHEADLEALVSDTDEFPKLTARESPTDAEDLVNLARERLAAAPDPCAPPPNRWQYIPQNLLQMEDCGRAEVLLDALTGRCDDPGATWRIERLRQQLGWQVARDPEGTCATSRP